MEFGFLHSSNWQRNDAIRHPNPIEMKRLFDSNVNYSLHLCGGFTTDALTGEFDELRKNLGKQLDCFTRMQLNLVGKRPKEKYSIHSVNQTIKQIIIQTRNVNSMQMFSHLTNHYLRTKPEINCVPLFDLSGGRGIHTDISLDSFIFDENYFGIAGGINPNNCVKTVEDILTFDPIERSFWIDMETGVRDNQDRFSTEACYEVCNKLKEFI